MPEVEQSDVEDMLQLPGVGGVGPDEGLQGWKTVGGAGQVRTGLCCPSLRPVLCSSPCQAMTDTQPGQHDRYEQPKSTLMCFCFFLIPKNKKISLLATVNKPNITSLE